MDTACISITLIKCNISNVYFYGKQGASTGVYTKFSLFLWILTIIWTLYQNKEIAFLDIRTNHLQHHSFGRAEANNSGSYSIEEMINANNYISIHLIDFNEWGIALKITTTINAFFITTCKQRTISKV